MTYSDLLKVIWCYFLDSIYLHDLALSDLVCRTHIKLHDMTILDQLRSVSGLINLTPDLYERLASCQAFV